MSKNIGVEKPKLHDIPVDVCGGEARAAEFLCHIRVAALSVTVSNQKVIKQISQHKYFSQHAHTWQRKLSSQHIYTQLSTQTYGYKTLSRKLNINNCQQMHLLSLISLQN